MFAPIIVTADAEETAREVHIDATLPRYGNFLEEGFDSLWIVSNGKLARIDFGDNSITDIPIDGSIGSGPFGRGMAVGEGAVWVPDVDRKVVYKIGPQTKRVVQRIPADMVGAGGSIGAGEGAIWVITGAGSNELTRYSTETGAEEAKISLPSRSWAALVAFGAVWVTGTGNDELYR
jgi:hypothetical protein